MPRAALTYPEPFPEARLRPLSGETELAIAAASAARGSRPARVTGVLTAAYERIDGAIVTADLIRQICSGGREWLLQRAALMMRADLEWFEAPCTACGEPYDVDVTLDAAPRKPAGPGFPITEIETQMGVRRFEAPCGWHEERAARVGGADDPRRTFAALTGLADNAEAEAAGFEDADLERIDAALEALSPDVADSTLSSCPACGAETEARVEPLRFTFPSPASILAESHLLASVYHWSETAILALSPDRRRAYAELIKRDQAPRATPQGGQR